jgi:hypothetical protein
MKDDCLKDILDQLWKRLSIEEKIAALNSLGFCLRCEEEDGKKVE